MSITKEEFKERGKNPKYRALFDFFKKNPETAYSKQDLMKGVCKKIKMTRNQLNLTLHIWTKAGLLQNKRPFYLITTKGRKSSGKMRYDKEKKIHFPV